MSQYLPYKDIKWDNDTTLEEVIATDDEASKGYIVECDLSFPEEIHEKIKEYPPCPENIAPKLEWMTDFQKQLLSNKKTESNPDKLQKSLHMKLIPHLNEHKNYVIHYRNLKFIKELGASIDKVHNIISFQQKPWLKDYIDLNTNKRKAAKNEFEKDFFKLINNSCYGKTMENVRNRVHVKLTTSEKKAVKWRSDP